MSAREELSALADRIEREAKHEGFLEALDLVAEEISDLRAFRVEAFASGPARSEAQTKAAASPESPGKPGVSRETAAPPGATVSLRAEEVKVWRAISTLIAEGAAVTHATIASRAGVAAAHVAGKIKELAGHGLVRAEGHGRGRRYFVLRDPPEDGVGRPETESAPAPKDKRNKSRFPAEVAPDPGSVSGLAPDHPAVVEGRSLFPGAVVESLASPRLLVSGVNQRKLGDRVVKGPWAGMPIFALTLEERASCPHSCYHWRTCFGNGMPRARRHRHGPDLEAGLERELGALEDQNPGGFVVRLHILGDFYSPDYVAAWGDWLERFPALRIFGYTAWPRDSAIGGAVAELTEHAWERCAIRFSAPAPMPQGATTIWRKPKAAREPEGIVCPAQTGRTANCGTCGLCWHPNAREETIVFIAHGRIGRPSSSEKPPRAASRGNGGTPISTNPGPPS